MKLICLHCAFKLLINLFLLFKVFGEKMNLNVTFRRWCQCVKLQRNPALCECIFDLKYSKPLYSASKALPPHVTGLSPNMGKKKPIQIKAIAEVIIVSSPSQHFLDPPFSASHGLYQENPLIPSKIEPRVCFFRHVPGWKLLQYLKTFILELLGFFFLRNFPTLPHDD